MDVQRATVYGRTGDHVAAVALWGEVLGDQPGDYRRDTGVFWARQAASLAALGETERVVEIAQAAATACGGTGSRRIRGELLALLAAASGWSGTVQGRELNEIVAAVA